MKSRNDIGYEMTQARLAAGLTQTELAALMGTRQSGVARLETGRSSPTLMTLEKLAEVTGHRLEIRLIPT